MVTQTRTTIALCFAVAVLDGFDTQAIGVAAPRLAAELGLSSAVLGMALSATNIGLVLGASAGGWLTDRWGRKPVLVASVVTFGAFTLATTRTATFELLFAARLGAGLGFGAALPNLMAIAAEISPPARRGRTATMMFCGLPCGGGAVALVGWLTPQQDWRQLFVIGGLLTLGLAPALHYLMRDTRLPRVERPEAQAPLQWLAFVPLYGAAYLLLRHAATLPGAASLGGITAWLAVLPSAMALYLLAHRRVLFGDGRAVGSLLLWTVFVPTLLILYLVLNWLPTLVAAKGFPADAAQAALWFNVGSIAGTLAMGRVVDWLGVRWPIALAYAGLIGALLALSRAVVLTEILALSAIVGCLMSGAQFAFYGAAASFYPPQMRGRGSGAAIAWGRLGSVAGPLAGGYLLSGGLSAGGVVAAMAPPAILAGIAAFAFSFCSPADE
jgi:AAHS family 3-hydroxyphenylpropionic acid transporter